MGRAKRLGSGTRSAGLAIEYVRTRKVVRLLGWLYGEPIEPVEIPVGELWRRLGIDPQEFGAPRHYLLFAGSHRTTGGGLRDLIGTFDSEERAWDAFRELRQTHPSTQGWAELATIDGFGQVSQIAWFGLHPARGADTGRPSAGSPAAGDRKRALRKLLGQGEGVGAGAGTGYLRAVTPS